MQLWIGGLGSWPQSSHAGHQRPPPGPESVKYALEESGREKDERPIFFPCPAREKRKGPQARRARTLAAVRQRGFPEETRGPVRLTSDHWDRWNRRPEAFAKRRILHGGLDR
jgi:hypothetical protein